MKRRPGDKRGKCPLCKTTIFLNHPHMCAGREPRPEILTQEEEKALKQILDWAKEEHGKAQQGYFSPGGWAGHVLLELLKRSRAQRDPEGGKS